LKQQVITALDKAEKSAELEAKMKSLEDQTSMLFSMISDLSEGNKYMTEILKRAGEQLKCKFPGAPESFSPLTRALNLFLLLQVFFLIVPLKKC
jgi:hypothetical protein